MINGAARESSQETNDTNVLFSDKSRFCIQTHDSHLHVQQRPGKWHLPENIYSWYRPNHWYHGVGYHKLQCTHIVRVCRGDVKHHHVCWRLFNRFYWYSCSTKAMCCSSKIMPIYSYSKYSEIWLATSLVGMTVTTYPTPIRHIWHDKVIPDCSASLWLLKICINRWKRHAIIYCRIIFVICMIISIWKYKCVLMSMLYTLCSNRGLSTVDIPLTLAYICVLICVYVINYITSVYNLVIFCEWK